MRDAEYTDREKVFAKGHFLGLIAKFGDGDWRCSSHPEAESFASRDEVIEWLVQRSNEYWASVEC